jgi:predicted nucleic acid-binding protein
LQTIGTLGVLLMAKDKGHIAALKPLLKALRETGFHMSNDLYRQVLDSGGETEEF